MMKARKKTPKKGQHWGILGGAFDPIHLGHINLARELCDKLKLDGILFVIAYKHPFKSSSISESYKHRLNMLNIVLNDENFVISEIEKDNNLNGSTLETVKSLKKKYPETKFSFLIGSDNVSQLKFWHKPEEIFKTINVVAGTRPHYKKETQGSLYKDKIQIIEIDEKDVSSTFIKEFLEQKKYSNLKGLLDDRLIEYIRENGLYQNV